MKRFREMVAAVRELYPKDTFFDSFEQNYRNIKVARRIYRAYNQALTTLDNESWQTLKDKAVCHFRDHRQGQTKQGFFHQLNEAFAYRYLVRKGFREVRILRERHAPTPDIAFYNRDAQICFCEVKTLGISDDEIGRRSSQKVYNGLQYSRLSTGFMNKLHDDIKKAWQQIGVPGERGLAYVMITFDDIALDFYRSYRMQLIASLRAWGHRNLFIKVGVLGNKRISMTSW